MVFNTLRVNVIYKLMRLFFTVLRHFFFSVGHIAVSSSYEVLTLDAIRADRNPVFWFGVAANDPLSW